MVIKTCRFNGFKVSFLIVLALMTLTQALPVWGDSSKSTISNIRTDYGDNSQVEISISGTGNFSAGEPKFYSNPPRLVYDFQSTVLTFNKGRTTRIDINRNSLEMMAIAQFQTNPNIVRLVFRFNCGDKKSCMNVLKASASKNGLIISYQPLISSSKQKPEKPEQIQDMQQDFGIINVLKYKLINDKCDHFIMEASKELFPSSAKQDSESVNLTFKNLQFSFPGDAKFKNTYSVPIDGALVDQVKMFNRTGEVLMSLKLKESVVSSLIDYNLVSLGDNKLRIEIITTTGIDADSGIELKKEDSELKDVPRFEEKQKSEMAQKPDVAVKSVQKATIKGIRYIPIENGERFIFEVEGDFKPQIARLNYPSRLSIQIPETSVIMPKDAVDKYRVQIDGALVNEMRVFIKDDSEYPGSVIQYYYDIPPTDTLIHKLYETETSGIYHIDVFPLTEKEHSTVPEMSRIPQSSKPNVQSAQSDEPQQITDDNQLVSFITDDKPKTVQASDTGTLPDNQLSVTPKKDPVVKIPIIDVTPVEPLDKTAIEETLPIKPEEKDKTPFGSINFPLNQMFTPDTFIENLECVPLIVIVLFNKEKNSTHLYILTSTNGKLQWQHLKT